MSDQTWMSSPETATSTGIDTAPGAPEVSTRAVLQELVAAEANRERGRAAKGVMVGVGLSALFWIGCALAWLW